MDQVEQYLFGSEEFAWGVGSRELPSGLTASLYAGLSKSRTVEKKFWPTLALPSLLEGVLGESGAVASYFD